MMFKSLYLLLTTLSGLAIAKQHQPPSPKLAFAYSVEISIIEQVPITSPFAETAFTYFSNSTISGPLINGTTNSSIAIFTLPLSTNTPSGRFTSYYQGTTSDGTAFSVRETGVENTTDPSSPSSSATQQWEIGGNYSVLSESTIVCTAEIGASSLTNNCFIVG